ncbi:MAG TPA: PAS domain-containing sensor histidine kinase [Phycisphaerales bacterium]|nr:PAS domain-containing sensor histidine kinase [Phycisphaerales bacterium]
MTSALSVEPTAAADLAATASPSRSMRVIGGVAAVLSLLSALLTFLVLADLTPIAPTHRVVVTLLLVNGVTVLILLGVIAREVWQVVLARRRGRAGARLHVRIVGLFAVIAAVPAILVAIVASITLDRGLDRLFSTRTKTVIQNSMYVANAYLREHAQSIRGDIMAMAIDVGRAKPMFDQDRDRFRQFMTAQAQVRGLSSAIIVGPNAEVIERADVKAEHENIMPSSSGLASTTEAEPRIGIVFEANAVASMIKLRGYENSWLHATRPLDPQVVSQLRETQASVSDFASLEARRLGVQLAFALMYTVIALTVLLSAAWLGLNFANRLVAPIRRLIGAANIVSTGNLYVQVPIQRSEGDLAQLGETFNKMTSELRTQRDDITRTRDLIDQRRRFTEAVLAGASAGVIGVDAEGRISILNRSAERLIGQSQTEAAGRMLTDIVPELKDVFVHAQAGVQRLVQDQVTISREGRERNLSVRVTTEQSGDPEHGYVVTLDDITELVLAQRTSAWADVARRIAHEIKNPLTPIQLSAERLKRKYGRSITDDPAVFQQCTETIIRQVDDIKRMVDEFSKFARMPKPVIAAEDAADTVRQVVFLMRVGNADIDIDLEIAEDPMLAQFDRRLISQGLTNIIKNATEAIGAVPQTQGHKGRINVLTARNGGDIVIDVIDNGIGLPKENRNRLLEPYVTTREKGTGLGLAIVGRILEDHGGVIELRDAADKFPGQQGAWVRLRFTAAPIATTPPDTPKTKPRDSELSTTMSEH